MATTTSEELLTKANESFVDEDYTTALSFYNKAISLSETNEQAFSKRSYCHYLLENYEECVTDAAHCLALNPNNSKALLRKGMGLLAMEQFQLAKSCFLDGETRFPKKEQWMTWVEKCIKEQGEDEDCMTISDLGLTNKMKKFGEEEPVLGWSERPTMGESLTSFSEFTSGLSSPMLMRKGGAVSPVSFGEGGGAKKVLLSEEEKKVEALKEKELGNRSYLQDDYEEAIEHYSNAIVLQPENHLLYTNRASAYFRDEQLENALEDAFKSIKINNKWSKGYYRAGIILIQLGKHEEGLTILRESLQICTEDDGKEKGKEGEKGGKGGKMNKDIHTAIELGEVFLEASKLGFDMRMAPVNGKIHENIFYNHSILSGERFADLATAVTMTLSSTSTRCVRQAFVDQMGRIVSLESSVSDQTIISRLNSGEINQIYVFVVVTKEEGGGVTQKFSYKEPRPGGAGESAFEIFPLSVIQLDVLDLTLTLLAREVCPNLHVNKKLKC